MTVVHAQRAHSKLPPSGAYRWMHCPGSIRLAAGLEESPSVFADEGTAAHQLAEQCLSSGRDAVVFKGGTIEVKSNAFKVDAEMVDAVQTYLDVVRAIADESEEFEVEQRMDMSAIVSGVFGTGDAIAYRSAPTRRVTIVDLKYGKGVAVEVEENEQLLTYAMGVAQRYHNRGVDEVELVIVQPRAPHRDGPVRRWVTDVVGLYEHAMAMQAAAVATAQPDAPLVPGPWCKFCKAAAICPALEGAVLAAAGVRAGHGELTLADPAAYDSEQLSAKLRMLPLVATWLKGVEQFAHAEALRGHMPPGFKLVAKRATRKWKDEDTAVATLRLVGVDDDDLFETSVRSPAQVEKAIPAKERGSLMKELAASVSSGTVLAPIEDPRGAVDPNTAIGFTAETIEERE